MITKKTDGRDALGLMIALMGGNLGASHVRRYGARPDDSARHIITHKVRGKSVADIIKDTRGGGLTDERKREKGGKQ